MATLYRHSSDNRDNPCVVSAAADLGHNEYHAAERLTVEFPEGWEIADGEDGKSHLYDADGIEVTHMRVSDDVGSVLTAGAGVLTILSRETL